MKTIKKKRLLICLLISMLIIALVVFAPRFLYRQARISYELTQRVDFKLDIDVYSNTVRIVDFRGRWLSMYAKVYIPPEMYDQIKEEFIKCVRVTPNNTCDEELDESSDNYFYDGESLLSKLSRVNRMRQQSGLQSMNLNDYEVLFIAEAMYGAWFTTGGTIYILVKETSNDIYLYIWSFV